jgi:hypothetical protein
VLQYFVEEVFGARLALFHVAKKFVFGAVFQNMTTQPCAPKAFQDISGA